MARKPKSTEDVESTETTATRSKRILISVYREDAVKLIAIQSDLWRESIAKGEPKKPSAADAVHYVVAQHEESVVAK